jgi:hypothetical protein
LIILISLGEVVAAMAQKKGAESGGASDPFLDFDFVALGAMLTAIACYLLYFSCVPLGWQGPGLVSYNRFSVEAMSTTVMTASLAAIGAAYSRLSEQEHKYSGIQNQDDPFRDQTSSLSD